jgi:hemerythrin-like metal-binding protein
MAFIEWSERLSVGIAYIDGQHGKIVQLINKLHDSIIRGHGQELPGPVLAELVAYAKTHFAVEELLFRQHHYPDAPEHEKEHAAFRQQAAALEADFVSGKAALTQKTMGFLRSWLLNHIMGTDMKYKPFLNAKGVC